MAVAQFKVMFDGRMVDGAVPAEVKANLAKLFNIPVEKIEPLFAGGRKMIRPNVDEATARKFQAAFTRAGAVAIVVDADGNEWPALVAPPTGRTSASAPSSPTTEPAPSSKVPPARPARATSAAPATRPPVAERPAAEHSSAATTQAAELTRSALAEAGRAPPPLVARGIPLAPDDMTMAEAGTMLLEAHKPVATPPFDTSHLSLCEPGADLSENREVASPEYDLSTFELAPPGTPLSEYT